MDAICTGEGEFAFEELLSGLVEGRDVTATRNFWFRRADGQVIRNRFLPLQTPQQMEELPFPQYGAASERLYRPGRGFVRMARTDYLLNDGLGNATLWSIGGPFHCSYCGSTRSIANDPAHRRIRHPCARYMVDQVADVRRRSPRWLPVLAPGAGGGLAAPVPPPPAATGPVPTRPAAAISRPGSGRGSRRPRPAGCRGQR